VSEISSINSRVGHNAALVGNDQDGWLYGSKNGEEFKFFGADNNELKRFPTLQDFLGSDEGKRYDRIARMPTTRDQDMAMQREGIKSINREYNLGSGSCAQYADDVIQAGGIKLDQDAMQTMNRIVPNKQYDEFIRNPSVTIIR